MVKTIPKEMYLPPVHICFKLRDLFDSILGHDTEKSESYRTILTQEVTRERQVSHFAMYGSETVSTCAVINICSRFIFRFQGFRRSQRRIQARSE